MIMSGGTEIECVWCLDGVDRHTGGDAAHDRDRHRGDRVVGLIADMRDGAGSDSPSEAALR